MTNLDLIATNQQRLETLASNLRSLKCALEDDGATEASAEVEKAEDAVDGALQCLRAAAQYAEPA